MSQVCILDLHPVPGPQPSVPPYLPPHVKGIRGREKGTPLGNFGMGCRFIRTEMLFAVDTCINKKQTEVRTTHRENKKR